MKAMFNYGFSPLDVFYSFLERTLLPTVDNLALLVDLGHAVNVIDVDKRLQTAAL